MLEQDGQSPSIRKGNVQWQVEWKIRYSLCPSIPYEKVAYHQQLSLFPIYFSPQHVGRNASAEYFWETGTRVDAVLFAEKPGPTAASILHPAPRPCLCSAPQFLFAPPYSGSSCARVPVPGPQMVRCFPVD